MHEVQILECTGVLEGLTGDNLHMLAAFKKRRETLYASLVWLNMFWPCLLAKGDSFWQSQEDAVSWEVWGWLLFSLIHCHDTEDKVRGFAELYVHVPEAEKEKEIEHQVKLFMAAKAGAWLLNKGGRNWSATVKSSGSSTPSSRAPPQGSPTGTKRRISGSASVRNGGSAQKKPNSAGKNTPAKNRKYKPVVKHKLEMDLPTEHSEGDVIRYSEFDDYISSCEDPKPDCVVWPCSLCPRDNVWACCTTLKNIGEKRWDVAFADEVTFYKGTTRDQFDIIYGEINQPQISVLKGLRFLESLRDHWKEKHKKDGIPMPPILE